MKIETMLENKDKLLSSIKKGEVSVNEVVDALFELNEQKKSFYYLQNKYYIELLNCKDKFEELGYEDMVKEIEEVL